MLLDAFSGTYGPEQMFSTVVQLECPDEADECFIYLIYSLPVASCVCDSLLGLRRRVGLVAESRLSLLSLRLWSVCVLLLLLWRLRVCVSMFLLAQYLQLQEELLLLQESGVGRVHGRRRLLCLLVWRNVLVVLELLHLGLHIFGLLVSVLVWRLGLWHSVRHSVSVQGLQDYRYRLSNWGSNKCLKWMNRFSWPWQ